MLDVMGVDRVEGPLLLLEGFGGAAYGEVVEVHGAGRPRLGEVLTASEDAAVIELWDDTAGLAPERLRVRLRGEILTAPAAEEMLGRVFDGLGRPRDGLPPPLAERRLDVHGRPINPAARAYPQDPIRTGITAIDLLNTLVRGQKLPLLSGAGLPHNELAAQIALQAGIAQEAGASGVSAGVTPGADAGRFAVVFVALGISHATAAYFRERFESTGLLARTALFLNLADDAPMERIVTPRMALTLAEFLAFERDYHVLVLLTDMTNYAEALRELSARKNEVPGRKGYPGYLYTDLASIYERCGRIAGSRGSLTQVPILSMPGDDITHPVPDLTGYITEGQVVLSRSLHRAGVYPPVDVPLSLSRLMKDGIGEGRTRADHAELAAQLYASYAHVQEIRNLATIIGDAALAPIDRTYLAFGERFEKEVLQQGPDEVRPVEESLDRGWDALSALPADELTRVSETVLAARYRGRLRAAARRSEESAGGAPEEGGAAGAREADAGDKDQRVGGTRGRDAREGDAPGDRARGEDDAA